jgi:hypothetical protein
MSLSEITMSRIMTDTELQPFRLISYWKRLRLDTLCPSARSNFSVAVKYEAEKTGVDAHYVSSHQNAEFYNSPTQIEFTGCEDGNSPQKSKNHRYD